MMYADLALAQRLERLEGTACARFVEARARLSPASGACWTTVAGTYAMFDTPESPITQTFGLGMFEPVTPQDLDVLEQYFWQKGAPVNHEVSPLAGVETFALLVDRGYKPIDLTSVMYRSVDEPLTTPVNPAVRVRVVEADEYDLWAKTNADGWIGEHPEFNDLLLDLGRVIAAKKGTGPFLAELDGVPVAAGSLSISDGAALLAGASTMPEARRQGAQLALLDARLRFAAEHGCDLAMMCAAPGSSSQRNAERNGFRIAYTRAKWSQRLAPNIESR